MASFIVTSEGTIHVTIDTKPYVVPKSHVNYEKVKENLTSMTDEELLTLVNVSRTIENYSTNKCEVRYGVVYYNGQPLHNNMTDRILEMVREGFPFEWMLRFLENLMENPSYQSIQELYDFLSHAGLPITEDGCFLAYKGVTDNFKDCHTRTFDNSPGTINEITRNQVDDDRERHCSYGFHVGTFNYASNFAQGHVVLVKVNPRDAVSVPTDHSCEKLRVCRYEVVAEYKDSKHLEQRDVYSDYSRIKC